MPSNNRSRLKQIEMLFEFERHAKTKLENQVPAPGGPGEKPKWTTGRKTAVGTSVSNQSRVWFTISRGILNEIYFPSVDQANTRTMRFLVADGDHFFSDEARNAKHRVTAIAPGVPAYRIETECHHGRYRLMKEVITDPDRDALLLAVQFEPLSKGLHLYLALDPHVGDAGSNNNGWVGRYKGNRMFFATRENTALALASTTEFAAMSVGYAGESDGYTDIHRHFKMTSHYTDAECGNVVLCGEIPQNALTGRFRIALGFGSQPAEAAQQAIAGTLYDFNETRERYCRGWGEKQRLYLDLDSTNQWQEHLYRVSTAVLETHESKRFPGAVTASLSVPWGFARGDDTIAGYHVIWPRDMVQAALAKLACGDSESARRSLFYLTCTQEAEGSWPQNMWLDGTANWTGVQLDGTSYGILLADQLRRENQLGACDPWPMIRNAVGYLLRSGPVSDQERWEENPGYSTNTMPVEIAALLAAADFADEAKELTLASLLRDTADAWNECIDEVTYASGTKLAKKYDVAGYYIRIAPPETIETGLTDETSLKLKNQPKERAERRAVDVVSPDALGLVRFGLRAPNDKRIQDTVKVIDGELRTMVSTGPIWHRYSGDGYGEHEDGRPFDKTGKGRGWPLLAGERAHFEIAAGNFDAADQLRRTIEAQTTECGMIPEQVWDAEDIPEHDLWNGHPTHSGTPLVWAHAEYIRLLRSLKERRVWDRPPQPVQRYQVEKRQASFAIWSFRCQRGFLKHGKDLRVDCTNEAKVRWSSDGWRSFQDVSSTNTGLGLHYVLLNTADLRVGSKIFFTVFWIDCNRWEGRNFEVTVVS